MLQVGKSYRTRSGGVGLVQRSFSVGGRRNFTKVSDDTKFIVVVNKRLETFNSDGSYIKKAVEHPLDLLEEVEA